MRRGTAALCGLLIVGSASLAAEPAGGDPFPAIPELEGNVTFWIRVFSEWSSGQVAIHDLEHPAIVYEVIDLPGGREGRYTDEQREFVASYRESWEAYLEGIRDKRRRDEPLDEIERRWVDYLVEHLGEAAFERAHERIRSQRGLRDRFRSGLTRSYRYLDRFRAIFREAGLPEDLAYLPHVESSFEYHALSTAGAAGVWQFTRSTGRRFLEVSSVVDERLDPIAAAAGAAAYLQEAHEALETWPLALTSYNHGVQGMRRAKERFGTDFGRIYREYDGRGFGFASRNFYAEFLAARAIAREPERFFPEGFDREAPFALEHLVLERRASPGHVARELGLPLETLAGINRAWSRRAVRLGLALPAGTRVWLPEGAATAAGRSIRPEPDLPAAVPATYVVRRGDTLSHIARRFGVDVRLLREMNALSPRSSLIRVGQRLQVSDGPPRIHRVGRGDTLSGIARRYGVDVASLRRANGLGAWESLIRSGQTLRLPADARDVASRRHVVRRGDTLLRIASAYGIRLGDLLHANTLTIRSVIHPGQILHIPGG